MKRTFGALTLATGLVTGGCGPRVTPPRKTDVYLYADTRRLVEFVEEAARLVEQRGTGAFAEYDSPGTKWRSSPTYLFVYDISGVCVWHGLNPELVGHNLLSIHDTMGKPLVQQMVAVGRRPEPEASDWIFYHWEEQTDFMPAWKSSYIRKAVAPDGKVYLVGSGSSRVKVEKVFVQRKVDEAARLLEEHGPAAAFEDFKSPASPFHFLGTFVFVLDGKARSLVDPAYPTRQGRDMSGFRDVVGRPVMAEVLEKLKTSDTAWVQFLWPRRGERVPSRRLMYVRKVVVGGETLLVGSDLFLASPIWMKA